MTASDHVAQALRTAAPKGCLTENEAFGGPRRFNLLTRAGLARVSVDDAQPARRGASPPYVQLFVRFEVVPVAVHLPLPGYQDRLNRYTGKWNHHLPPEPDLAAAKALRLFDSLWPAPEEIPYLEFLSAVEGMLSRRRINDFNAYVKAPDRKWLRVIPTCGHRVPAAWCAGCGTDYAGQEAREFWEAVNYFTLGIGRPQ